MCYEYCRNEGKIVEEVNKLDDEKALYQVLEVLNSKQSIDEKDIDATKYIDKLFKKNDLLLKRLS